MQKKGGEWKFFDAGQERKGTIQQNMAAAAAVAASSRGGGGRLPTSTSE